MYDLSILIPARNEMFLARTVQDILENIEGNTEVIIGLDGEWANPAVVDDPRVTVVYYPESIGQRAMTNQLCKLSRAKYIIKCDAHCSFDKGFDVKLMKDMQPDWTVVPIMYNLHAFDWKCLKCDRRWYQGPKPQFCCIDDDGHARNPDCDSTQFERVMVWKARFNKGGNSSYSFDTTLHFQYFRHFKDKNKGQLVETMSLQGSFFMLTRDKYWELNICDEKHGSWGQQGVEVACKTWLSGGKVICNRNTWYSHMFRTQKDFSFPYHQSNSQIENARNYSRDIWFNNKFEKQIRPLSWLINKFKPNFWYGPDADKEVFNRVMQAGEKFDEGKKKGIIYFTDNRLNLKIAKSVQKQLKKIGLPIVSASLKPMDFGTNVHLPLERGYLTMFKQILAALEASTADIIYFCEHDVIYHPSHFDFTPERKDTFYYDVNVWKIRLPDGLALWVDNCRQVSGICVYRETAIQHYKERVLYIEQNGYNRNIGFEPGTHGRVKWPTEYRSESYMAEFPMLDIRHNQNLTPNRWKKEQFRSQKNTEGWTETYNVPGWGDTREFVKQYV